MTERDKLLRQLSEYDFAVIELQIYLDSHPFDEEAEKKLNEYLKEAKILRDEFERKFGPIVATSENSNSWGWIADPWPWNTREDI
jgi:spore coat protein JB